MTGRLHLDVPSAEDPGYRAGLRIAKHLGTLVADRRAHHAIKATAIQIPSLPIGVEEVVEPLRDGRAPAGSDAGADQGLGRQEPVPQAKPLQRRQSRRRQMLADPIAVMGGAFDDERPSSMTAQRQGRRAPGNAATDDHHIAVQVTGLRIGHLGPSSTAPAP